MAITIPVNTRLEETVRAACAIDVPWALLERFSTLHRLSGSEQERAAFDYIAAELSRFGIAHELTETTEFVSWPLGASIEDVSDGFAPLAKTSSMSISTDGEVREADAVYWPTAYATGVSTFFAVSELPEGDLAGKIVVTEGMPNATKVRDLGNRGAVAAVFVGPGERIHEGICTSIWGSPDLDSMDRQPSIVIISVNKREGTQLIERIKAGPVRLKYSTKLDTQWRPIPRLVATIPGATLPEEFVLLHAHLDSWHEGIGDNATGDATLLEVARVLHQQREHLHRTVKFAWWSGHSHGRYAGSTRFADDFALELDEHCIAQVNCDSPGCRWAEVFTNMMWTEESGPLVNGAVTDVSGVVPTWVRPLRAGDYSFNNLGLSGAFMLSSTMTEEARAEKGYHAVGGCGANIAWHTEDDTMEIADRDNLLRDIQIYATAIVRLANSPVTPLDFRLLAASMRDTLATYQAEIGDHFDLTPANADFAVLLAALDDFYTRVDALQDGETGSNAAQAASAAQRQLARLLVPVNYAREGRFTQDPAETVLALPDIAVSRRVAKVEQGSHTYYAAQSSLRRGLNRLRSALRQATAAATATTREIAG